MSGYPTYRDLRTPSPVLLASFVPVFVEIIQPLVIFPTFRHASQIVPALSLLGTKGLSVPLSRPWTLEPLLHISMVTAPWGQSETRRKTMASKKAIKKLKKGTKIQPTKNL